jgi:hypothetical protein
MLKAGVALAREKTEIFETGNKLFASCLILAMSITVFKRVSKSLCIRSPFFS